MLVALNRTKLEETAAAVAAATPLVIDLDLSEQSSAKAFVERALATFGRIDALANIAGAAPQIDHQINGVPTVLGKDGPWPDDG